MTALQFQANGEPRPEGSMRLQYQNGEPRIVHDRGAELNAWRSTVRAAALRALAGAPMIDRYVPVCLAVEFVLPRARGRGRRTDLELPSQYPDVDKLARAVADALSGAAYHDDAQVVELSASKRYANDDGGEIPHAVVKLQTLEVAQKELAL